MKGVGVRCTRTRWKQSSIGLQSVRRKKKLKLRRKIVLCSCAFSHGRCTMAGGDVSMNDDDRYAFRGNVDMGIDTWSWCKFRSRTVVATRAAEISWKFKRSTNIRNGNYLVDNNRRCGRKINVALVCLYEQSSLTVQRTPHFWSNTHLHDITRLDSNFVFTAHCAKWCTKCPKKTWKKNKIYQK